jgi:hypothetical protein
LLRRVKIFIAPIIIDFDNELNIKILIPFRTYFPLSFEKIGSSVCFIS